MKYHMHHYKLDCETKEGHCHTVKGFCSGFIGIGPLHFHSYYGVSTYTDHTHAFSGITGFPVKTENGHVHKIEGLLEVNHFHTHEYKGFTSEEISYIHRRIPGQALV